MSLAPAVVSAAPGIISSARVSGDDATAIVEFNFNCKVAYVQHEPPVSGDRLRIYLEPTEICSGVSPTAAESRGRYRPANSELARIVDFEYDGAAAPGPVLTVTFSEPVSYSVEASPLSFQIVLQVRPGPQPGGNAAPVESAATVETRQVPRTKPQTPAYVVNLVSMQRVPTVADVPALALASDQRVYYTEAVVEGKTWYRLRLGDFESAESARTVLESLSARYPGAWIDRADSGAAAVDLTVAARASVAEDTDATTTLDDSALSEVDALMQEARLYMVEGERSRAIQIYTKVLQMPANPRQPEAQEFLALAREKNGQLAHAKAEYQRYLSLYPDGDGAARVGQRLAALLASDRPAVDKNATVGSSQNVRPKVSNWRVQTFFSQFYRRDVNLPNEQDEIISQSALYSDFNIDARRRGERFDFGTRLTAGYRNDFLGESLGSGNEATISYAYADLADARTGLRARLGRQTSNSGGVLGRFDGLNLGYQLSERMQLNAVFGMPAYSARDGIDSAKTFYGASFDYGPLFDGLEFGFFYIQQEVEGIDDRQAVGGEFRYFGPNQSVWGLVDYDTSYDELSSAFLQASWRIGTRLTLNGSFDTRHSPFLSTSNAMIGQPVLTFAELLELYPVDEIRQFSLDRSPLSTTYTVGFSYTLTPKLQVTADGNNTTVDASPASGGVIANPEYSYRYYSTNIVASSLIKEGDVTILGFRQSESDTAKTMSLTIDSRFPFGRSWRVNPRLRVDRRERLGENGYEWIYTPGIRIQYRRSQKLRIDFEAGRQYARRETDVVNLDRESYYFNVGYQVFF